MLRFLPGYTHLDYLESILFEVVRLPPRDIGAGDDGIGEDVTGDVGLLEAVDDEGVGAADARRKYDVQSDVSLDETVQRDRLQH